MLFSSKFWDALYLSLVFFGDVNVDIDWNIYLLSIDIFWRMMKYLSIYLDWSK